MSYLIVIPALDEAALQDCLATIDDELLGDVLVIDNSDAGIFDTSAARFYRGLPHEHERDVRPRCNLGISGSMNVAIRECFANDHDGVAWVSTSMRFGDDGGLRLIEAAYSCPFGVIGLPAALHAFALDRDVFDVCGYWDEGFWPAYWEDTDYRRRMRLAGMHPPLVEIGGTWRDGGGYDVLRALNPGRQVVNFVAHEQRYAEKWGGKPDHEIYDTPWDLGCDLDYWLPVTREELIDRYGLGL